jgi:hypothetical protein
MTAPTPTALDRLRPVTLQLRNAADEVIGSFAARVLPAGPGISSGAWAITHTLGSPAGGMHTFVSFVDGTLAELEDERIIDDIVRQVANELYARTWAFHYRPERVVDSVLAYGSVLRERVEVSAVEVWT